MTGWSCTESRSDQGFAGPLHSQVRCFDGNDLFCQAMGTIDGKTAGVGKAVEHLGSEADPADTVAAVTLIQEKTGF